MLIRSQDKKTLVNLDNTNAIRIYEGYTGFNVDAWGANIDYEIGEYSTEEKAIKVLDMICEYQLKKIDSTMNFSYNLEFNVKETRNVVFQMPQDKEVEV